MLHCTVPVVHGAPGLVGHVTPLTQSTHVALALQTRPVPQLVPGVSGWPSTQPPSHATVPATHGAPALVEHAPAGAHVALQTPRRHDWPEGQVTPTHATSVHAPLMHTLPCGQGVVPHASRSHTPR